METTQLKIDDRVFVPGGAIGELMVIYADRRDGGEALVRFPDGDRQLFPLHKLKAVPEGAPDLRARYPAG